MPIQVIATYVKIPPPPVDLLTAGDDIFPFCDLTVTLLAIVDPLENLQGHTILWEQLSGTTVTLDTPTEISTTYTKIVNDQTDKEFKVTIDKGIPNEEQSDVVIVYATPTSLTESSCPSEPWYGTAFDVIDVINASAQPLIPEPAGIINPDVTTIDQILISWDTVPDVTLQPYLTSVTLYESVFAGSPENYTYTEVATIPSDGTFEYIGDSLIYYLRTDFDVDGNLSWGRGVQNDHRDVIISPVHVVDDKVNDMALTSSYEVTKFYNLRFFYVDNMPSSAITGDGGITDRYINKLEEVPADLSYSGFASDNAVVFRTDPGGIGGG